ncbi:MarR family transcriptional regulator [Streptomyces diacarni]|uniref:MarR family transcriptional regulator n=1 Tax=Streptomyces diacarni TaxID=2800381 RepID=A0A367EEX1_9ACTN|nr:MarR family winged helix-turn-helix transcriptional regulator [Streptomyces diacarni]RCG16282.1 MarR family transcriptional regulator [Streptomyces diacarni]
MDEEERRLIDLERELTLLCRHFVASRGPRSGQTLERSAYVLLTRLEAGDPLTLKELAHTFQVNVSTINRQVSPMLKMGLVERIPDPDGGMARKYRPTTLGLERLRVDREISLEGAARLIRTTEWTDTTTQHFLTLLSQLNQSIERLEGLSLDRSPETSTPTDPAH